MAEKPLTYDKAYAELEQIMNDLQADKIGVDELTVKVKRAVELINFCSQMLRSTEDEVGKLVKKLGLA